MDTVVIRFRGRDFRFRLDQHSGQLWRDPNDRIHLPAKQFDLLTLFVTNPHRLFPKDELIRRVWGEDRDVSDEVIARAVSDLRHALGDDTAAPEFIATVPKKGYRFDAEVEIDSERIDPLGSPAPPRPANAPLVHALDATPLDLQFKTWATQADSIFALTPIRDEPRLVGRQFELWVARRQLMVPGQHVLLYGALGVGKTSLANILAMTLARELPRLWCRTEVNDGDTFREISRKIRKSLRCELGDPRLATELDLSSSELAEEFHVIAREHPFVVILDEFQRPMTREAAVALAELLKGLGDRRACAQFVVVGIADNIRDLIAGHESLVLRHLLPIRVGTMTRPTTLEIVRRGFNDLATHGWPDLMSSPGLERIGEAITALSLGLPTMVNDLARETSRVALDNRSPRVSETDFDNGLRRLTSRYSQELDVDLRGQLAHDKYLIACAAARTDSRGCRSAHAVVRALTMLTGDHVDEAEIWPRLAKHLNTGVLKQESNNGELQFALNLLPSRLLVAAVAERSIELDRLGALWRHTTDQILDELEYLIFEFLRLADTGRIESAREVYRQAEARLAFAIEHLRNHPGYPAQRERLLVLEGRFPDLSRMIDLGPPPTVG
jgi:DNA-binding winged helix-turn-helix (wHTH) protein